MVGMKTFIKSYWETAVASANLNNEVRKPEYDTRNRTIDSIHPFFYRKKKNIAIKLFTDDIMKGN